MKDIHNIINDLKPYTPEQMRPVVATGPIDEAIPILEEMIQLFQCATCHLKRFKTFVESNKEAMKHVNKLVFDGRTCSAFHMCCDGNARAEFVAVLINNGACPLVKTFYGQNAMDLAFSKKDVFHLLLKCAAKFLPSEEQTQLFAKLLKNTKLHCMCNMHALIHATNGLVLDTKHDNMHLGIHFMVNLEISTLTYIISKFKGNDNVIFKMMCYACFVDKCAVIKQCVKQKIFSVNYKYPPSVRKCLFCFLHLGSKCFVHCDKSFGI